MIRKEELIEKSKKNQLNGARVDEYQIENDEMMYPIDSYVINFKGYSTNVTINRVNQPQAINLENDFFDEDYSLFMTKNNEKIGFAKSNIQINMRKLTHRYIPFREFKLDPKDDIKKIGDNKHSCMVIDIEMTSKISFKDNKSDIYYDHISVAVDLNGCFIYCINYTDGTLPTVLVSKDILSKSELENIVFEPSTITIYNSYYHPHDYKQVTEKVFPNVVFGSPGGNLKGLTFDERKINFNDYENNDGVYGSYDPATKTITVKFADHIIARYAKGGLDQYSINSILMYDTYKSGFFQKEISDGIINVKDLIEKYKNLLHTNIKNGDDIEYRVFDFMKDELGTYYDYKSPDETSIIRVSSDEKFLEVFNFFDKKHDEQSGTDFKYPRFVYQYVAFDLEKDLPYSIYTAENEDTNLECFVSSTKNRVINVSRDANNILFNSGKYYVTCNKNNDVINTNMGIEGQIIPYNIFGIPTHF